MPACGTRPHSDTVHDRHACCVHCTPVALTHPIRTLQPQRIRRRCHTEPRCHWRPSYTRGSLTRGTPPSFIRTRYTPADAAAAPPRSDRRPEYPPNPHSARVTLRHALRPQAAILHSVHITRGTCSAHSMRSAHIALSPVVLDHKGRHKVGAPPRSPLDDAAVPRHAHQLLPLRMPAAVPHDVAVVLQLMHDVPRDGVVHVHTAVGRPGVDAAAGGCGLRGPVRAYEGLKDLVATEGHDAVVHRPCRHHAGVRVLMPAVVVVAQGTLQSNAGRRQCRQCARKRTEAPEALGARNGGFCAGCRPRRPCDLASERRPSQSVLQGWGTVWSTTHSADLRVYHVCGALQPYVRIEELNRVMPRARCSASWPCSRSSWGGLARLTKREQEGGRRGRGGEGRTRSCSGMTLFPGVM